MVDQRTLQAEGKLAALIEWATKNPGTQLTSEDLLNRIESLLEKDNQRTGP